MYPSIILSWSRHFYKMKVIDFMLAFRSLKNNKLMLVHQPLQHYMLDKSVLIALSFLHLTNSQRCENSSWNHTFKSKPAKCKCLLFTTTGFIQIPKPVQFICVADKCIVICHDLIYKHHTLTDLETTWRLIKQKIRLSRAARY